MKIAEPHLGDRRSKHGREKGGRKERRRKGGGREVVTAHIYSWTIDCTHGRVCAGGSFGSFFWNTFGLPENQKPKHERRKRGGKEGKFDPC